MTARDVFTFAYCLGLLLALAGFAGRRLTDLIPHIFDQLLVGGIGIFVLAVVFSWIFSMGTSHQESNWDRKM